MYILVEALIVAFAVALVVFTARWARRWFPAGSRWPRVIAAGVFVLVFMGEEIAGHVQMQFVCPTAKVEVYGSVELPEVFYDEAGKPLFIRPNGLPDYDRLFGPVALKERLGHYINDSFHRERSAFVEQSVDCFRERETQRLLACAKRYVVAGGWTKRVINVDFFGLPSCGPYLSFEDLEGKILKRK